MKKICSVVIILYSAFSLAFGSDRENSFILSSPSFDAMESIPALYTCNSTNISPPLVWKNVPKSTQSLVLIVDDPDAPGGTWVHWVLYDIPETIDNLKAHIPQTETLSMGAKQGMSDFNELGYGGPCPPKGSHRYVFTLYALDTKLDLPAGKTKATLLKAMKTHIIEKTQLIGTYSRK